MPLFTVTMKARSRKTRRRHVRREGFTDYNDSYQLNFEFRGSCSDLSECPSRRES
jgi:hypothetical protein